MKRIINRIFADKDDVFKKCCQQAETPNTKRQASKFRRGMGKAYKYLDEVTKAG